LVRKVGEFENEEKRKSFIDDFFRKLKNPNE
jgi:hypothetical protein